MPPRHKKDTSWDPVNQWYDGQVGKKGHYYHQAIILPKLLEILGLDKTPQANLVDAGCGQGVFARHIPAHVKYAGLDLSPRLIEEARKRTGRRPHTAFHVADLTQPLQNQNLPLKEEEFSHGVCVLALQNMRSPHEALGQLGKLLQKGGKLVIVLNHPCFRIPRHTHWGVDEAKDTRFRRVDAYLSFQKIAIQAKPSMGEKSAVTWTFHHPLSTYINALSEAGFALTGMQEWCSDKVSDGRCARRENKSRAEIPLFLALVATKL